MGIVFVHIFFPLPLSLFTDRLLIMAVLSSAQCYLNMHMENYGSTIRDSRSNICNFDCNDIESTEDESTVLYLAILSTIEGGQVHHNLVVILLIVKFSCHKKGFVGEKRFFC